MLRVMRLVEQWREIVRGLPPGWTDARLTLTLADEKEAQRAAALLAPLNPGRRGTTIHFFCTRSGAGPAPQLVNGLLRRLDNEGIRGIRGELELVRAGEPVAAAAITRPTLAATWDAAVAALPPDWSDVYAEVELVSTDWLERAALLMAPLNPARYGGRPALRFRAARRFGYGASAEMTRRCLERLDQESIRGEVRILRALSDTEPVATQGPVWYVEGRSV
jgi:hypothetical protein